MKLTGDEHWYYLNQEKGFQGEVQFDKLTEKLKRSCHILNDLQLESSKSSFQLDSSLIFQETYSLFEFIGFNQDLSSIPLIEDESLLRPYQFCPLARVH